MGLSDLLRNILSREFAGMTKPSLFSTSLTGTKNQIREYHDTIEEALLYISKHKSFQNKEVIKNDDTLLQISKQNL